MRGQRRGRSALLELTNKAAESHALVSKGSTLPASEKSACIPTTTTSHSQDTSSQVPQTLTENYASGLRHLLETYQPTSSKGNVNVYSRRRRNDARGGNVAQVVDNGSASNADSVLPPSENSGATSEIAPEISRAWMFSDAPRSRFSVGVGRSLSYRRSSICSFRDDMLPRFSQAYDPRESISGRERPSSWSSPSTVADSADASSDDEGDDCGMYGRTRQSASRWRPRSSRGGKHRSRSNKRMPLERDCPGAPPSSPSCGHPVARGPATGAAARVDPDFVKEKAAYFAEVDAFVLEEATPSPAVAHPAASRARSLSPASAELWPLMRLNLGMELLPSLGDEEDEEGVCLPVVMERMSVRGSRKFSQACAQNLPSVTEHEAEHLQEMDTPPRSPTPSAETCDPVTVASSLLNSSCHDGSDVPRRQSSNVPHRTDVPHPPGRHRSSLTSTPHLPAVTPCPSPVDRCLRPSAGRISGWSQLSPVAGTLSPAPPMPSPMSDDRLASPDHTEKDNVPHGRQASSAGLRTDHFSGLQGSQLFMDRYRALHGQDVDDVADGSSPQGTSGWTRAHTARPHGSSGFRLSGAGRGSASPALDDVVCRLEEMHLANPCEGHPVDEDAWGSKHDSQEKEEEEALTGEEESVLPSAQGNEDTGDALDSSAQPQHGDALDALVVPSRAEEGGLGGLCEELEGLAVGHRVDSAREEEPVPQGNVELDDMALLLRECGQEVPQSLDACVEHYVGKKPVSKIGEGTYGEAFSGNGVIFKIVPFAGSALVNGEQQKAVCEILEEVRMTNILSNLRAPGDEDDGGSGIGGAAAASVDRAAAALRSSRLHATSNFIKTYGVKICSGPYPRRLVQAWDDWDKAHISENERVDVFGAGQHFVVFLFANGGADLERFELRDYREVQSLLLQVTASLAVAEAACGFEHRDLHWGNILLARTTGDGGTDNDGDLLRYRLHGQEMMINTHGVRVSLIDFTLSRLETDSGRVLFCDLSADPDIFKGKRGDPQAETYRHMKKLTKGDWSGRFPKTNCLWMHYLADIVLTQKKFMCTPDEMRSLRIFRKSILQYSSAEDLLKDDFFCGLERRKTHT
eukprot:jgi/Mesvir1/7005/Mv09140-RA.3